MLKKWYWNIHCKKMLKLGIHIYFNQDIKKYNYKHKQNPYIYIIYNNVYIINIILTTRTLLKACNLVFYASSLGKEFLILSTEKALEDFISWISIKSKCHYISKKYISGLLTNYSFLQKQKKSKKLQKNFKGIKYMKRVPDVIIMILNKNIKVNSSILIECNSLKISTICLIDVKFTNFKNIDNYLYLFDFYIPVNICTRSSIYYILNKLKFSILEGRLKNKL
uniref:ribosomal protein S2 n=1 Tax=Thonningia sanguinea TaxID=1618145 RepID=UPI0026E373E2|nr:ribosomal protein S2 [Thonningia sanguinea]WJE89136.1 ribosomal protein S2 [Thonningia sanguinea]